MTSPDPTLPETRPIPPARARLSGRSKAAVLGVAALVFAGAGVGVGMAVQTDGAAPSASAGTSAMTGKASEGRGKGTGGRQALQAWSLKYGANRATMPTIPPVASATQPQREAAAALAKATAAATAKYNDQAIAKAAGFDLQASLARVKAKGPRLAKVMQAIDAGSAGNAKAESNALAGNTGMAMLHVGNTANGSDGKVLDPSAPETLMYQYMGSGTWKVMGVMFSAKEAYPAPPPTPGGPITRWHYHSKGPGQVGGLMMHVFFVPDLGQAFATTMKKMS